jgi:hypothetical protein
MNFAFNSSVKYPFPPSCPGEALLDAGYDQLVALGSLYRRYLTDAIPHLPPAFDSSLFAIRASYLPRAVESAVGFLNGFYPPDSSGQTFDVTTGERGREPLIPGEAILGKLPVKATSSTEFPKFHAMRKKLLPVLEHYNMTDAGPLWLMGICDYFITSRCSNNSHTDLVTDAIFDGLRDDFDWMLDKFYRKTVKAVFWPIWELVSSEIDAILAAQKKTKFTLMSGHDVTMVATLVGAGIPEPIRLPPYASHMAIEVWDVVGPSLRFVLNGDVVPIAGRELTPLAEFRRMVEPLRPAEEL